MRTSKTLYGKDEDPQTGAITEHIYQHYDYVWKDGVLDSANIITYNNGVPGTESVKYLYDSEKTPVGFIFTDPEDNTNDLKAWYIKDLQGDVTSVYVDGYGVGIRYAYDAWGNVQYLAGNVTGLEGVLLFIVLAAYNPITYRGYSYDIESQMYYLQSRYYDPQIGRFLNADDADYINFDNTPVSSNIFTYCVNNPVMYQDIGGRWWLEKPEFKNGRYDRNAAIAYAKKWYNDFNNNYFHYSEADCANFVSQCLYAGGLQTAIQWHHNKGRKITVVESTKKYGLGKYFVRDCYKYYWDVTDSCHLVANQYDLFISTNFKSKCFSFKKSDNLANLIKNKSIKKGDLMYFDNDGDGHRTHAVIISKVTATSIYYAAHTNARFDQDISYFFNGHKNGKVYVITIK